MLYAVLLHFGSQSKFSNNYQWNWRDFRHRYGRVSGLQHRVWYARTRSGRLGKDAPNKVIIKVVYALPVMIVIYY